MWKCLCGNENSFEVREYITDIYFSTQSYNNNVVKDGIIVCKECGLSYSSMYYKKEKIEEMMILFKVNKVKEII